jgi:hypothetical protein
MSRAPKLSVPERAARYCAKLDPTVCGTQSCHHRTFGVACVLVQAFALGEGEAMGLLQEWAARGTHKWTEAELRHKLRSAAAEPGFRGKEGLMPRGCFLTRRDERSLREQLEAQRRDRKPEEIEAEKAAAAAEREERRKKLSFDREALSEAAGTWASVVNLAWLANRSALDPAIVSPDDYLRALYRPGEKVLVMDRYDDGHLWPDEPLPETGRDGVKMLANPVSGERLPNPRGRPGPDGQVPLSRRVVECVTTFRYLVIESDKADLRDWLGFLARAPIRIAAIYTSGGRSVHTLVRVDARTRGEFDEAKRRMGTFLGMLLVFGVDTGPLNPLAPTRLPGCWREGKSVAPTKPGERWQFFPFKRGPKLQKLLYLQPEPDGRPLVELPTLRDVEAHWRDQAQRLVDGYEVDGGEARVANALRYYANVCPTLRAALKDMPGTAEGSEE